MNTSSETFSIRDYLGVLRVRRWLVLGVTAIAIAIGLVYVVARSPVYEAIATLEFRDQTEDLGVFTPGVQVTPEIRPDQAAAAASRTVTRNDVVKRVEEDADTGLSGDELRDSVTATVEPDSNLVAVEGSADEARQAAVIANSFARETMLAARDEQRARYAADAKELSGLLGTGVDPATEAQYRTAIARLKTLSRVANPVEVTRTADVPSSPAAPKPVRDLALAALLGLMLGVGAAFLRNALDHRITDSHQIQHELGVPLVGYVRSDSLGLGGQSNNGSRFVSDDDLEAFRILRRNVDFLAGDEQISSVVVTSALPEEGKSTVAAWYAYASAVYGKRTLLVECDLRRPVLGSRFGVDNAPGLSDFLVGEAAPKDVLRAVAVHGRGEVDTLPLIPAGDDVFQPTELLGSKTFSTFVDQVSRAYDIVIFDSAPLLPVGDTLELIPQADAILLCVRLGQTTREQALAAQQAIGHLPERPIGLVITGVAPGSEDDYYGYYSAPGGVAPSAS